jgi:hypothetical protein
VEGQSLSSLERLRECGSCFIKRAGVTENNLCFQVIESMFDHFVIRVHPQCNDSAGAAPHYFAAQMHLSEHEPTRRDNSTMLD